MIESNVIEWLDFGDSTQKIDTYSKEYLLTFFRFFRALVKNKSFPIIELEITFIIISFIQFLSISAIFVNVDDDIILGILNYLKPFTLIFGVIDDTYSYYKLFIVFGAIILIDIILMLITLIMIKVKEFKSLIFIINALNIIIFHYLLGPSLVICLMIFLCDNEQEKYLKIKCFSQTKFLNSIISSIIALLYVFVSFIYSLYCNEIGAITNNINKKITRIYCNYELFILTVKIISFIFYYILRGKKNSFIFSMIYEGVLLIIFLIMFIYVNNYVYYYNNHINFITNFGWISNLWFSICIILKILFKINNLTSLLLIGWTIIFILLDKIYKMKELLLITESNFFEFKNIKSIEIFKNILLQKLEERKNTKSKILLNGIAKIFEENINNNPEINIRYQKLINDIYLNHKFNKNINLYILLIIYIIYSIKLEKTSNKDEIILYMSYFIINKFNNPTYAILLCSKISCLNHKSLYYKYVLSEDIKDHLIYKLNNSNKETINHIQIGSIILYYLYIDLFKMKIYDAISNQIDYFDLLKNKIVTNKAAKQILKTGEIILKIRKEIIIIWEKLIQLNPFSDEIYKDYILYLDTILQDDILTKEENKKYIMLKNSKLDKKESIYHNMFLNDTSSILLVDGYYSLGKILYSSQNFPFIFNYNGKELLNATIDDLIPNVIQTFHKELIDNVIKYSNINFIFKRHKLSFLKNKNGGLVRVKLFVKPTPNLSYGLTYLVYLQKVKESNFIILLDKDLKINGFTEIINAGNSFTMRNGYNLNQTILGYHIGLIIPDILPLLEYKNDEFNVIKKNCELKGYLYTTNKFNNLKPKVDKILDKIKSYNNSNEVDVQIEVTLQNINDEFDELIKELSKEKIRPISIFFEIRMFTFLDGKYKYYMINIINDIINGNENSNILKQEIIYPKSNNIKNDNSMSYISNTKKGIITQKANKKKDNLEEKNNGNINNIEFSTEESNKTFEKNEIAEEKFKKTIRTNSIDLLGFQSNYGDNGFNKLKIEIIDKREPFPIKIMKFLCFFFYIFTIIFMTYNEKLTKDALINLSKFLEYNIFFNMTKMNVATIYIASTNIKWQLHACNRTSQLVNMTALYEKLILETIDYLLMGKNEINNFDEEYKFITEKKHDIELNIYGYGSKENYKFNLDNLITFFINSGINLMEKYFFYLEELNKKKPMSIEQNTFGLEELDDLVELTYLYYISDIDGFKGENKKNRIDKVFKNFQIGFVFSGLSLLLILTIYIMLILRIHNIEIYFIGKLLNFNSPNFNIYLKKLEEIKKKLRNDNNDEDDKEDIDYDSESKKDSKGVEDEKKNDIAKKDINTHKNKKINEKQQKQKRDQIKIIIGYFLKNNLIFGIKIILIMILSLSYYIISIMIGNNKKNELVSFDAINDEIIGVFKESFDIYLKLKRELELYEKNLTNCVLDLNKTIYMMDIPKINDIKNPNLGNSIIEITSGSGYNKETLKNFTELFSENACIPLSHSTTGYRMCIYIWNGILAKGMEQTITKMSSVISTIIEELNTINTRTKSFNEVIQSSTMNTYESFIGFYYQRSYLIVDDIFKNFRSEKLNSIIKVLKILLFSYILVCNILSIILIYFVYSYKNIFSSFLYFIGILPSKYLSEDESFYKEIIKFGHNYF